MNGPRASYIISLLLGVISMTALVAGHLALTDIWHGESDLSLEWNVLRFVTFVIILFHISALATIWKAFRAHR